MCWKEDLGEFMSVKSHYCGGLYNENILVPALQELKDEFNRYDFFEANFYEGSYKRSLSNSNYYKPHCYFFNIKTRMESGFDFELKFHFNKGVLCLENRTFQKSLGEIFSDLLHLGEIDTQNNQRYYFDNSDLIDVDTITHVVVELFKSYRSYYWQTDSEVY
jgi:hypothetical protein